MAGQNMFDMLTSGAGQAAMGQLSKQFGLDDGMTQNAVKALLPALSGGLKRNVQQEGGLESLMRALQSGSHDRYLDQPETLATQETIDDGNGILGHLLGSKDMSRAVASKAAERTGLSDGLLKQMLPVVASMAMGSLSKQSKDSNIQNALMGAIADQVLGGSKQGGGLGGLLGGLFGGGQKQASPQQGGDVMGVIGGLLDADGDGNAMDDILQMVMKR